MTCALKIQCDFIWNVKVTVFIYLFILLTPRDTEPADVIGMGAILSILKPINPHDTQHAVQYRGHYH